MKKIILSASLILTIGFSNAHIEEGKSWQEDMPQKKVTHKVVNGAKEFGAVSTISHFVSPGLMNSLQ